MDKHREPVHRRRLQGSDHLPHSILSPCAFGMRIREGALWNQNCLMQSSEDCDLGASGAVISSLAKGHQDAPWAPTCPL